MSWSAEQYTRFEEQRTRPARDLLAAFPTTGVDRAIDLGCGPGNSTALLRERYPGAALLGIDSSPDMIAAARQRLPDVAFEVADLAAWDDNRPADVLFANASLQWVPDHAQLLPALLDRLTPGGHLAFQIPDNWEEPAHRLLRSLAADERWAGKLAGAERDHAHRHDAAWYHNLLRPMVDRLDLWRTIYFHELPDAAAIVEWFKGSALTPLLARLNEAEQADFLAAYLDAIAKAYPPTASGTVLLQFPRLFVVARRPVGGLTAEVRRA